MTEMDILKDAALALLEHDKRRLAVKESDETLRVLCRQWGEAAGLWGVSPDHLRRACETRGLLKGTNNV